MTVHHEHAMYYIGDHYIYTNCRLRYKLDHTLV